MKIILLDLFSGIGGFAKGLEDAGFEIVDHFFSEVDTHAIANYQNNFRHAKYVGSVVFVRHIIRTIRIAIKQNPGCKLVITFGSPCQDFSMAGNRTGLKGNKSSLIRFALFLVRWLKPELYIWENVKGAYTSNAGKDFWAIQKAFANITGYRREQQCVNTTWLLPQNRERIYFIGYVAGPGRGFRNVLPITQNGETFNIGIQNPQPQTKNFESENNVTVASTLSGSNNAGMHRDATYVQQSTIISRSHGYKKASETDISPALTASSFEQNNLIKQVNTSTESGGKQPYQHNRVYDDSGIMPNLDTGCRQKIKTKAVIIEPEHVHGAERIYTENAPAIQARYGTGGNNVPYVSVQPVLTPDRAEKRQNGRRFKDDNDDSFTLTAQDQHGIKITDEETEIIRRLTEIECERLQGFDDNWTRYGIYLARKKELKKQADQIIIIDGKTYIVREVPKTERYKMLGNAVTKKMVQLIGIRYLKSNL